MKILFPVFDKIDNYGGYSNGIRNTVLAANAIGLEADIVQVRTKADVEALDADMLHFSNFIHFAAIVGSLDRPYVIHLHGYCPEAHPAVDNINHRFDLNDRQREALENSKLIYSGFALRDFFEFPGKVIWNCVDLTTFYPRTNTRRKGVLSTINFTYSKGADRLIELAKTGIEIEVAGKQSGDTGGEGIFSNEALMRSGLTLLGPLARKQMAENLGKSEIFLHPSRLESCSLVIIEAICCGTPVIASNTGDNRSIIGDAGIVIQEWSVNTVRAAVDTIIENHDRFKENAWLRSNRFAPSVMGLALLQCYTEVING